MITDNAYEYIFDIFENSRYNEIVKKLFMKYGEGEPRVYSRVDFGDEGSKNDESLI